MFAFFFSLFISLSPGHAEMDGPCRASFEKFCKNVKPGGGAIFKCLKEHEAELPPECKAHAEKMKGQQGQGMGMGEGGHRGGKFKQAREACKTDREKFCKDVQPGSGGILKCMKENEAQLSADCKAALPKRE